MARSWPNFTPSDTLAWELHASIALAAIFLVTLMVWLRLRFQWFSDVFGLRSKVFRCF